MTFYKDCLGGKLTLQTIGESQRAAGMAKEAHNKVLHLALEKDGLVLMRLICCRVTELSVATLIVCALYAVAKRN